MSTCQTCGSLLLHQKLCSICQAVNYCNLQCQTKDWQQHKLICHRQAKGHRDHRLTNITKMCNDLLVSPKGARWEHYLTRLVVQIKKSNFGRSPLSFLSLRMIQRWVLENQPPDILTNSTYIDIMLSFHMVNSEYSNAARKKHHKQLTILQVINGECMNILSQKTTTHARLIMDANNEKQTGIVFFYRNKKKKKKRSSGKTGVWGFGTQWCINNYQTAHTTRLSIHDTRAIRYFITLITLQNDISTFEDPCHQVHLKT